MEFELVAVNPTEQPGFPEEVPAYLRALGVDFTTEQDTYSVVQRWLEGDPVSLCSRCAAALSTPRWSRIHQDRAGHHRDDLPRRSMNLFFHAAASMPPKFERRRPTW